MSKMIGVIKVFNTNTGQGTIESDFGIQYFFTYSECFTESDKWNIEQGDEVEFDLRYVDDMPIATKVKFYWEHTGGYN